MICQQFNKKPIISIPCYGDIFENIKRLLNQFETKTVFRRESKLNKYVKLGKETLDNFDKKNVVYKFNCKCGKCYVGQTKCPLRSRRKEHIDISS